LFTELLIRNTDLFCFEGGPPNLKLLRASHLRNPALQYSMCDLICDDVIIFC